MYAIRSYYGSGKTTLGMALLRLQSSAGQMNYVEIGELSGHLHDMAAAVLERETFLRASEERYRSVVTNLGEGLIVIAPDGLVVECNASAERILGRSRQDLVGAQISNDLGCFYREDGSLV